MSSITFNTGTTTYNVNYNPVDSSYTVTGADGKPATLSPDDLKQLENLLASLTTSSTTPLDPPSNTDSGVSNDFWVSMANAQQNATADVFEFLQLFVKLAGEMRKAAREERLSSLQNEVAAIGQQAAEMREAAQKRLDAAILQGSMQIAAGCVSVVAGAAAFKMAGGAKGDTMQQTLARAQALSTMGQGLSQILTGIGTIVSANKEHDAALDDAEAKEQEKLQKLAEAALEMAKEMMQTMMDMLHQVRDTMQAINQSNSETAKSIIHNV